MILISFGVNYAETESDYVISVENNYIGDRLLNDFLNGQDVILNVWSACYPDMNIMEHFWEMQGICKKVALMPTYCRTNS